MNDIFTLEINMLHRTGALIILFLLITGTILAEELVQKGEPIPLTQAGKAFIAPKWSPDGKQLAVSGLRYKGVYLLDFPSGNLQTLSEQPGIGFGLAWSPQGDAIAVRASHYEKYNQNSQVLILHLDGSTEAVSAKSPSLNGVPAWTTEGKHIYMTSGSRFRSYTLGSARSALSGELIYLNNMGIYQRDLESGSETLLSDPNVRVLHLAISPNQDQMAFSTASEQLWIADMDGSKAQKLGQGASPDWSPDGKWISCMVTEDDGHVFTGADILVYQAATGRVTNLTNTPDIYEMDPDWSPDGRWIAYDDERTGRIWVLEVEEK